MFRKFILRVFNLKILAIAVGIAIFQPKLTTAETSSADYIFLVDTDRQNCQHIGEKYREIKAFETENFYVNICKKDNNYYYLGEAKTGAITTIFLPANALAPKEMYRANNGNVAYIVNILPGKAILTIERNGEQVTMETSQPQRCANLKNGSSISLNNKLYYPMSDARILLDRAYLNLNQLETINLNKFSEFDPSAEYSHKAILNIPTCD